MAFIIPHLHHTHPASNGLAERAVQIVKNGLKRDRNGTIYDRMARILFNYRVLPQSTTGISPSELIFNRLIKSKLDLVQPDIPVCVEQKQMQQKEYHDMHARDCSLLVGEEIYRTAGNICGELNFANLR